MSYNMNDSLSTAAHVVQQALTPVFLLSGIAALLNVFASRLARVADQADALAGAPSTNDEHRRSLKLRSRALDVAVVLAAIAVAFTCAAVLVLFVGGLRHSARADLLFLAFGGAVALTMAAILAFVVEMLLAARGIRTKVDCDVPTSKEAGGERGRPSA